MKVIVVLEHPGVDWLVPALRLLDQRGHRVHLAIRRVKTADSHRKLEAILEECPGITVGPLPSGSGTGWVKLTRGLRLGIDYLRYLEPRYADAPKLRSRAEENAPPAVRRAARVARLIGPAGAAGLRRGLQALERGLDPPPYAEEFLKEQAPDVVVVTPLVDLGSRQADWLRAAKRLGLRTAFPVFSWDNLTNKGLLRDAPGVTLVWNDLQAHEAEELHGLPAEQIRLTGAPLCDPWFEWEPRRSREDFCREVGLSADRPIVLYLCSSRFVAPREGDFVRSWIERLRARGGIFAEAGFLIRPHPLNAEWQLLGVELDEPQVSVWPRLGEAPEDVASRQNYFDSIFHAAAVVGINTTAQIESAIVGRPVHTVLAEEFRATQEGTLHFHYLRADEFGLLHVGRTFEEHAEQLEESLRGRADDGRNERFLRRFVRPLGLERSASESVADAIEELGRAPAPATDRGPLAAPLIRLALAPLARQAGKRSTRRLGDKSRDATPAKRLRRTVGRLRQDEGVSVVAGPWLEDEIGELLYWIPFLRWAQTGSIGLRERLFVFCRASSAAWYAGIGARRAELDAVLSEDESAARAFDLGDGAVARLAAAGVSAARPKLASHNPARRIQNRLLEFAPLVPPELPAGLELPEEFIAVRFDQESAETAAALGERVPVVGLEGLDRAAQTAVLARARGFVGTYGVEAYVAVLLGRPAVVFGAEEADPTDLRIASTFLARAPFGRLETIEAGEPAERALALLERHAESLAGVGG
jgi:hypothetical protein